MAPGGGGGRPDEPPDFRTMTSEQKRKRYSESAGRIEAVVAGILSPRQVDRLRQITRQVRGPAAFGDADVAEALDLSRDQKDAIRRIQAEYRTEARKLPGPFGPPPDHGGPPPDHRGPRFDGPDGFGGFDRFEDARAAQQSLRENTVARIVAGLKPSQLSTWQRLIGDVLPGVAALSREPFGPGGFGGPGGPGHDGPGDHGPGGPGGPGGPDRRGPGGPRPGDWGPDDHGPGGGPGRRGGSDDRGFPGGPDHEGRGPGGPGRGGP
jgi:hypothetical protein